MNEMRLPTKVEIALAWTNSGGQLDRYGNPIGTAHCWYEGCGYRDYLLYAKDIGYNKPISWVVDHIIPLSKGGTWAPKNLQALHNFCNMKKLSE